MAVFRERVKCEVFAHLDAHANMTIEDIAIVAALAGEHALQTIGVERAL